MEDTSGASFFFLKMLIEFILKYLNPTIRIREWQKYATSFAL